LPGLTRQSIILCKAMDARVKSAHDALTIFPNLAAMHRACQALGRNPGGKR
jgi:hypothetical protein